MPGSWMSSQGTCPGEAPVLTLSSQAISYQSWGWKTAAPHHGRGAAGHHLQTWRTCCDKEPKGVCGGMSSLRGLDGFIFQHSIIQGTNQDGFIQRAIDASNAYASIIEAVKKAERAAHDADEAAGEALMVRAVGSPAKMSKRQTPSPVLQLFTPVRRALLPLPSET